MNNQISEQNLQNMAAKLPKEISPERDLWSGIERAIQNKEQIKAQSKPLFGSSKIIPLSWAASVVVAVLVSWITLVPEQFEPKSPINLVMAMQEDFELQKQGMLVSFGKPKISELSVEMQTQLTQLASARHSIEQALLDDPSNSDLLNLLRWTQKQEIDLLKQLYSPKWQTI